MGSLSQTASSATFAKERAALASVVGSSIFARSPNLARILTFLCEAHFQGSAASLKEYSIATGALGRGDEFDPRISSVVRVEVSRLRKKLAQYYATEGATDRIQIVLPETGYQPQFVERTGVPPISTDDFTPAAPDDAEEMSPASNVFQRSPEGNRRIEKLLIALLIAGAAVSVWVLYSMHNRPAERAPSAHRSPNLQNAATGQNEAILIHPGAESVNYTDRHGRTWGVDQFFTGGSAFNRPKRIFGSADPALYQSGREGSFAYAIPVPKRMYELHLHFAETFWGYDLSDWDGSCSRLFDVLLNGKAILSGFDIVSDAGGPDLADERVFTGVMPASDGMIHLEFTGHIGAALLNGIELLPSGPLMRPVRIAAGSDSGYLDHEGRYWGLDQYYIGGRTLKHAPHTNNTDDPELFSAEHWGHFTYRIPAAPGLYSVRVRFAERHYGKSNYEGGVGSRVFDVYCNGVFFLKNFDIIKAAGGENRAVDEVLHGIAPDAQGKIVLTFQPGNTYATVNAIEVAPEGV
jgi:Malectin domain